MFNEILFSVSRWKIFVRSISSVLISFLFFSLIFFGVCMGWLMHSEEIKSSVLNSVFVLSALTLCGFYLYSILSSILDIILKRYTVKHVYVTNTYTIYGKTSLVYISTIDDNGNFETYADTDVKFAGAISSYKFYNLCASSSSKKIFRCDPTTKEFDAETYIRRYNDANSHKFLNKLKIYEGLYGNELPFSHFLTALLMIVTAILGTVVIIVSSLNR